MKLEQYIKKNLRILLEAENPYQTELDMLLDKISAYGMESLTGAEKHQLKNVSQGKSPDALSQSEMDIIDNFGKDEYNGLNFEEFYLHLRELIEEKYGEFSYMFFPDFHEETIQIRRYITQEESELFGIVKWVDNKRVCYEHSHFKYKYCDEPHFFTVHWMKEFEENL